MRYLLGLLILASMPVMADTQDRIAHAKAVTVLVTNEGFLGGGRGSGIIIDPLHVVTCAHMVQSSKDELFIYTYPLGTVIKGHAQYVDRDNDVMLVLLESSATVTVFAELETHYYDGEPITIIGNALGSMKWLVSRGIIAGSERDQVLTDVQINPGNSGGPWLDDDGYVVALTDWGITPKSGPGVTGGVPAIKILNMLASYEQSKKMQQVFLEMFGGKK